MNYWHLNQELATGAADGTSWADAFQTIEAAMAACASPGGDIVFIKNDKTYAASINISPTYLYRHAMLIGVKPGTTHEGAAVIESDLIPGIETGAGTRAYADADVPIISTEGGDYGIDIRSNLFVYGVRIKAGSFLHVAASAGEEHFIECHLSANHNDTGYPNATYIGYGPGGQLQVYTVRCKFSFGGTDDGWTGKILSHNGGGLWHDVDGDFNSMSNASGALISTPTTWSGEILLEGSDLSALTSLTGLFSGGFVGGYYRAINCKTPANLPPFIGNIDTSSAPIFEMYRCGANPGTPLSAGASFQEFWRRTANGTVKSETTAVRTGGSTDGATGLYSLAMTPGFDSANALTQPRFTPLWSPWMNGWVLGTGSSKTLTIFIANNDGVNYNDIEVIFEVRYPSEDGNRRAGFKRSVGFFKASAALATDSSVWASPAANPQKITLAINPRYSGPIQVRVGFMKSFTASSKTLYVDPKLVIA